MSYCPYCGLELELDEHSLLECLNCQIAMTPEAVGGMWRGRWLGAQTMESLDVFIERVRKTL